MKTILLSITVLFTISFSFGQTQNVYNYPFDGTTADLSTAGWLLTNQSNPTGAGTWTIPTALNAAFSGGGNTGGDTSYVLVNYTSTNGAGTISNWLISPTVSVQDGDVVTFYTRKGGDGSSVYPDNLQLRMSTMGSASVIPSTGENDLGDFTTLAVEINPNLDTTSYPFIWTQYTYTVSGVPTATNCKFAFRYYVIDGGISGANSDIIGVDDFSIDRTLGANDFFKNNFSMYPNPIKDVLNITNNSNVVMNEAKITDINGRIVKEMNFKGITNTQINISELNAGVYFLKINTEQGVGTTKIVKK